MQDIHISSRRLKVVNIIQIELSQEGQMCYCVYFTKTVDSIQKLCKVYKLSKTEERTISSSRDHDA